MDLHTYTKPHRKQAVFCVNTRWVLWWCRKRGLVIAFTLVFPPHLLFQAGAAVPFISAAFPITLFLVIPISYKLPSFLFLDSSLPTLCFAPGKSKHINKSYSQTLDSFLSFHCSALQSPYASHASPAFLCEAVWCWEQINQEEGGGRWRRVGTWAFSLALLKAQGRKGHSAPLKLSKPPCS